MPGAAGYEVEVNSSSDWAPGSKVCCTPLHLGSNAVTLGRSLSPIVQLDNNTYYWRVRAIDSNDNAGVWNVGDPFTQTFANVPPTTAPSVKNLRLRDNLGDPNDGVDPATVGYPLVTGPPVLSWNPVPGASSYQVDVTPFEDGACNWTHSPTEHWVETTSSTSWTPLGWGWNNVKPFPNPASVSADIADDGRRAHATAPACGRPTAPRASPARRRSATGRTFRRTTRPPSPGPIRRSQAPARRARSPRPTTSSRRRGVTVGRMPLFTWKTVTGAQSYFVLVSRDPSFTNLVDYAFTRIAGLRAAHGQRRAHATRTS